MSLSHAIPEHSNTISNKFSKLQELVKHQINECTKGKDFESVEREVHAAFMAVEKIALGEMLQAYDIDSPIVELNGQLHKRSVQCKQTYLTAAGSIEIKRSLFRSTRNSQSICPLELRAGMIEKRWSPVAAKQALLVVTQLTPSEAEGLFKELGGMSPSKSSLDRLPKKLSARWQQSQFEYESLLRNEFKIPDKATTLSVSLDGVLIPMKGAVILPGDSRYEEASCGTISYFDSEGEVLDIRRYGNMPESRKISLKEFLAKEVEQGLKSRPDLTLVKVADGAKDNWTFLDGKLPEGISVLDFYHAAEHLKKAFELMHGITSSKATAEFMKYRSILRHDDKGVSKVIRHLNSHLKKHPKKTALKTELNYFKNNKHRCQYALIAGQNLPIGSGIVEATCKTLVTQRLKRSGMSWKTEGGQAILTFRALLQSNLFDSAWKKLSGSYFSVIELPKNVLPFCQR